MVEKLGKPHGEPWRWVGGFFNINCTSKPLNKLHLFNSKNSTNNKFAFSSDLLIKLEHVYYRKFASLEAGYEVARDRKKKVRKMNERLARLNRQLCEEKSITPYEFLASASHLCESTYNRVALRKKQRRAAGEVPDDVMHDAQGLLEPEEMGRPPVPLLEDRVDEGYLEAPPQPHLPPAAPAPPAPPAAGANAIAEVAADEPSDSDIRGGEPQGRTAHQNSPARRAAEAAQRRAAEAADLRDAAAEQDQRQTRARVAAAAAADEAARRVARRAQEPLVAPRQTRARAAAAAAAEEAVALAQQEPQRRRLRPRGATATEAAADEVVQAPRRQQRAVPEPRHARQGAVERARARAGVRTGACESGRCSLRYYQENREMSEICTLFLQMSNKTEVQLWKRLLWTRMSSQMHPS